MGTGGNRGHFAGPDPEHAVAWPAHMPSSAGSGRSCPCSLATFFVLAVVLVDVAACGEVDWVRISRLRSPSIERQRK